MDPWAWVILCSCVGGLLAMLVAVLLLESNGWDEDEEEHEPR